MIFYRSARDFSTILISIILQHYNYKARILEPAQKFAKFSLRSYTYLYTSTIKSLERFSVIAIQDSYFPYSYILVML